MQPLRLTAGPSANQLAWDATAYDLDLVPDLGTHVLRGSARVRARVVAGPLFRMELDLDDVMTVDSVKVAGVAAPFTRGSGLLTVDLGRAWVTGETPDLTVWYQGTPAPGGFGSVFAFTTRYGRPLIWTLSEPYGARAWWPCKDAPEDKADSVSVRVTVPTGMKTVGNGTLVESSDNGTVAVTRWVERHPIATYLVSLASYPYALRSDTYHPLGGGSMPILFYLYPEDTTVAASTNALIKNMIAAHAARFGEYPFADEKYGEAEFNWGGGMENQTVTSLYAASYEWLAIHELTHQWWGDWVTCRDFRHVWLNEGFATWGEALWQETQGGLPAYHSYMYGNRYLGAGTVIVPDGADESRMFDGGLTYDKASWIPHMLRHVLGDSTFFAALREYGRRFGYGSATTEDLRGVCEEFAGRPLGKFFDEWVYGEYYPQYGFQWRSEPAGDGWDVTLDLGQYQSWQVFWMPVDVRITTSTRIRTFTAWDSLAAQSFTFHVTEPPVSVFVDPDEWILGTKTTLAPGAVGPVAAGLALFPPHPNPARGRADLSFALPRPMPARLEVFDARGARVATLADGPLAAGAHALAWDGRDPAGRPAPAGLYLVRLTAGGEERTRRMVLVR